MLSKFSSFFRQIFPALLLSPDDLLLECLIIKWDLKLRHKGAGRYNYRWFKVPPPSHRHTEKMSFPTVSIPGVLFCFFFFLLFFLLLISFYTCSLTVSFPEEKWPCLEKKTPKLCSLSLYLWHLSQLHHLRHFSCFRKSDTKNGRLEPRRSVLILHYMYSQATVAIDFYNL